jgi:hypothetical protein
MFQSIQTLLFSPLRSIQSSDESRVGEHSELFERTDSDTWLNEFDAHSIDIMHWRMYLLTLYHANPYIIERNEYFLKNIFETSKTYLKSIFSDSYKIGTDFSTGLESTS